MKRHIIILTFSLFTVIGFGQNVTNPKIEKVFLDKSDTTRICYTIITHQNSLGQDIYSSFQVLVKQQKKFYNKLTYPKS